MSALGHGHPVLTRAIAEQAAKLWSVLRLVIARHGQDELTAETTRRVALYQ